MAPGSLEVDKPAQAKSIEPVKPLKKRRPVLASTAAGVVVLIVVAALGNCEFARSSVDRGAAFQRL